jgi:hypothetical protein
LAIIGAGIVTPTTLWQISIRNWPSWLPIGPPAFTIPVSNALVIAHPCFGEGGGASLFWTSDGTSHEQRSDIVQCKAKRVPKAADTYSFALVLPQGWNIDAFTGTFVIDQGSNVDHVGAHVHWVVKYGGSTICEVDAYWGRPGRCSASNTVNAGSSDRLTIDQTVEDRGQNPGNPFFAGIASPTLLVRQPS